MEEKKEEWKNHEKKGRSEKSTIKGTNMEYK